MSRNPRLTMLSHPFTGKTVDLCKSHHVIGRKKGGADVIIDHSTVSGSHCELVRSSDGGYIVRDSGMSTNGTRVSGMLVTEHYLQDSDILQIGAVECMYDASLQGSSAITSVNTQIRIATNPVIPNSDISLSPAWTRPEDNPLLGVGYKAILALLAFVILILSLVVTLRLVNI